jgi:hypothetical protein
LAWAIQPGFALACSCSRCHTLEAVLAAPLHLVFIVPVLDLLQLIHAGFQLPHLLRQSNEAEEKPQEQQPGEQQA